jgi:hypothetical protein
MTKEEVESLFKLAGIPVLKTWELVNQYWPRCEAYAAIREAHPWWLVKTKCGLVEIGWRKRVIYIGWEDTPVRKVVTEDVTTKVETYVHAWSVNKALEYLQALRGELLVNEPEEYSDE